MLETISVLPSLKTSSTRRVGSDLPTFGENMVQAWLKRTRLFRKVRRVFSQQTAYLRRSYQLESLCRVSADGQGLKYSQTESTDSQTRSPTGSGLALLIFSASLRH